MYVFLYHFNDSLEVVGIAENTQLTLTLRLQHPHTLLFWVKHATALHSCNITRSWYKKHINGMGNFPHVFPDSLAPSENRISRKTHGPAPYTWRSLAVKITKKRLWKKCADIFYFFSTLLLMSGVIHFNVQLLLPLKTDSVNINT